MRTTWKPLSNKTKRDERENYKSMLFIDDFWTCCTDVWKCEWATSKKHNKVKKD